jgi:membrane fusion protein, multidrug efflux system
LKKKTILQFLNFYFLCYKREKNWPLYSELDNVMDPHNSQNSKLPFKLTGERISLMLGGTLIGALVIVFGFKLATPIVKKACQSILEAPDKGERDTRVASIEATILKPGTISKRITTIGKLRANEFVTIHAEMQGRIKEIDFKEGTMVKKGDVLIRFEDDELQAEVAKAEADVEYRQVKFDRMQKPEFKGFTRGHEYDQERGNLNMAKAAVELAKAKLAKATITAPFEGKIGLINVSVGAFIDTQKELVTIVDFDPMKIDFKVPEVHIHDIGVGQTAEVKVDSFPDQIFHATVEAIDSRVDPQTHSIAVRATIPNEDGKLQTGLFGSVSVIIGVKNDALIVPESALGREGDIEYVWVVVNGKAGRKRVLTGTKENGQVEITAGLREGEIVVTSGQLKLGEGTAVKISNMAGGEVEVPEEDSTATHSKASTAKKEDKTPAAQPDAKPAEASKDEKSETPNTNALETPTPKAEGSPANTAPTQVNNEPTKVENAEPSNLTNPQTVAPNTGSSAISDSAQSAEPKAELPISQNSEPQEQKAEASSPSLPEGNNQKAESNNLESTTSSAQTPSLDAHPQISPIQDGTPAQPVTTQETKPEDSINKPLDALKTSSNDVNNKSESERSELKTKVEVDKDVATNTDNKSYFTRLYTKARDFVVNLFKGS